MKIRISTSNFRSVVGHAYGVVKTSTTLPILGNLLLEAKGTTLKVTGCNLDQWLETSVSCEVQEDGIVTLPARTLSEIAKVVSAESLIISVDAELKATVTAGTNRFNFSGLPADDFPSVMEGTGEAKEWTLPCEHLHSNLARVASAQCSDPARYVLCGVLLETDGTSAKWIATDGRFFSLVQDEWSGPKAKVILPADFVSQAIQLTEQKGDATLRAYHNCVGLNVGESTITSKLIEGAFPNYSPFLRVKAQGSAEVDRSVFLSELARAAVAGVNITSGQCSPHFRFTPDLLNIVAYNGAGNEGHASMEVKTKDSLDIQLNRKFLDAALRSLPEDTVRFEWLDDVNPLTIKAGNYTGVIMCIRTGAPKETK